MSVVVDIPTALRGLREAIAERGAHFRYKGTDCFYERNGRPDCLVGLALHKVGVPIETLRALDTASSANGSLRAYALSQPEHRGRLGDVVVTVDAACVLGAAQHCQDVGASWKVALAAAEARAQDLKVISTFVGEPSATPAAD